MCYDVVGTTWSVCENYSVPRCVFMYVCIYIHHEVESIYIHHPLQIEYHGKPTQYTIVSRGSCVRPSKLKSESKVPVTAPARLLPSTKRCRPVIGPLVPNTTDHASIATHKLQYIYKDST